jgi:hypothetical protein
MKRKEFIMATMQKQFSTQLEANEEFEAREDLALEDARPLAEELHGVTDESLRENLPEATYQAYFAPQQQLGGEAEQEGDAVTVVLSSAQVDAVVKGINSIAVKTVEKGKMDIGEYVLSVVFKDNLKAASSHSPNKDESMSQIVNHDDLAVDRRQLGTWVRAAAFRRELTQDNVDCTQLSYSQFAALLRLKDETKRRELAERASRDNLTVRQILSEVESTKKHRPATNEQKEIFKKFEEPLKLIMDEQAKSLLSDPQRLTAELESADRLELVKLIDRQNKVIDESKSFLDQVKKTLIRIELEPAVDTEA